MPGEVVATVKMYGLQESRETMLALPVWLRSKVVYYALSAAASPLKREVIRLLRMYFKWEPKGKPPHLSTGNLRKAIKIGPGKVNNRKLQCAVIVGIKRRKDSARIFGKVVLASKAKRRKGYNRRLELRRLGAISAFYGIPLHKGFAVRTKNGVRVVRSRPFMTDAAKVVRGAMVRAFNEAVTEKLPEVIEHFRTRRAARGRGKAA